MRSKVKETILIVEDEVLVQMLLKDFLDELGYSVISAGDAKSALLHLDSDGSIDLLLADVALPGMNGRELAEVARKLRPSLPVLFATGYDDEHEGLRNELGPGMAVITKPFNMEQLGQAMRALLSRPSADQQPELDQTS